MESGRMRTAVALAAALAAGAAWAAEAGRIESVTVYRGQAEVIRVVPAPEEAGALQVVVEALPERVVPDSLYADGDEGVRIRAVRYRTRVVTEAPREEVRELDRQIEAIEKSLRQNAAAQALVRQKGEVLDRLQAFSAPAAHEEMKKGVLDAEQLSKLTGFLFEQRDTLAEKALELDEQARDLNKEIALLKQKRAQLTRSTARTAREAVLFLEKAKRGKADIRLGYLVQGVSWTPSYNLRAVSGRDAVEMEYIASIQQMSGEDWKDVRLTLSTATPTLASEAPGLAPFWVTLGAAGPRPPLRDIARLKMRQQEAEQQYRAAPSLGERARREADANRAAAEYSALYLQGKVRPEQYAPQAGPATQADALAVNYPLGGRHSLKSRTDRQTVRILTATLDAKPFRLAVPVLTRYVYRQAEVKNTAGHVLLPGRAHAYLDGQFAGTGNVPLVRPGQRFIAGFGVDTQLTARQKLHKREERIVGGNKEQTYTCHLLLENFGRQAADVRLLDRIPVARDGNIRVSLVEETLEHALSTDAFYTRFQKPHGILRWDVKVPGEATEAKAFTVTYTFRLEFDRKLQINPITGVKRGAKEKEILPAEQLDLIMNKKAF